MTKRIIMVSGKNTHRYVKRTPTHITFTDNPLIASDYHEICDDPDELMSSDYVYMTNKFPSGTDISIKDLVVEIKLNDVDLATTTVESKLRIAAISKLSPMEISVLGLQSDAVFAKISKPDTPEKRIDGFSKNPTMTVSSKLVSILGIKRPSIYDEDDYDDD